MKRVAVTVVVVVFMLLVGVTIYRASSNEPSHFWGKVSDATVAYNGQPSSSAKVYRSPDGQVLVDLIECGDALYVAIPHDNYVGMPNHSNFFMFPGFVYSKELLPPTAPPGKWETEPNLIIQPGLVEFTSIKKARVKVSW